MKEKVMSITEIQDELKRISKIDYMPDRYAATRQLYIQNKKSGLVVIHYAELLADFNDDIYLARAVKLCESLLKNSNNWAGNAKLVLYRIHRKLNPNQKSYKEWYEELSELKDRYAHVSRLLAKRIEYEMVKLIDDMLALTEYVRQGDVDSLKKKYDALLQSCEAGDYALRNKVCVSYLTLLIRTKDYQEAKRVLDFMKEKQGFLTSDFDRVYFYVQYQLGLLPKNYQNASSYYESQILKYDRNSAIVHVYKHERGENNSPDIQTFNEDIDIRELFPTMEMAIEKIKPSETRMVADIYYIDMGEVIGRFGNQPATIVEVITEVGTKNIHTMYPVILCKNGLYKRREEALIRTNIKPSGEKGKH